MALSRSAILTAQDLTTEAILCPEWGGDVLVRGMNGAQREAYESMLVDERGNPRPDASEHARARLVAICAVDEDGDLLFTPADVAALSAKNAAPLNRVAEAALRLSGMGVKIEDRAKNS